MNKYPPSIDQQREPYNDEAGWNVERDLLEPFQDGESVEEYLRRAAHNDTDYAGIYDGQQAVEFEKNGDEWVVLDSSRNTE